MFRYERPQKGRLRQFHQIGVELIGAPEPLADVEVIALGADILERLGVLAHTVLEINTLGDRESRLAYRAVLVAYLEGHKERLSQDSLARLERNPMRILDSKDEGDRAVVAEAPLAARAPEPGEPGLLRPRRRRAWRGSASPAGTARAWSAAWTTTPTPPSSSPPPPWAPRAR